MKVKRILAASISALMLISFAGCDMFTTTKIDVDSLDEIDEDEWIDALEEIGLTESDYIAYGNDSFSFPDGKSFKIEYEVDAETDNCCYYYSRLPNTEEAEALFEYYEDIYSDVLSNTGGQFSGTKGYDSTDDSGYIVLNGEFEEDDGYCPYYDILIWKDDVVVMAYLINIDSNTDVAVGKKEIGEFLDALGYPKP